MKKKTKKLKPSPPKTSPLNLSLYSLGCTKNLVDSEILLGDLLASGHFVLSHPNDAHILIVNTCGFIQNAKEESLHTLRQAAKLKKQGPCHTLIAIGCLAQRQPKELQQLVPEIDYVLPLQHYQQLPAILENVAAKRIPVRTKQSVYPEIARFRLTPRHYAYLRISEGCNHTCSFCVIPKIRGKHRSKPIEYLLQEAQELVHDGAKELNLIADDSTYYGTDLYGKPSLPTLLEQLNSLPNLHWIRIFYAYPNTVNDELIQAISSLERVVPYLDMPIQHISDPVLKAMKRGTSQRIRDTIQKLKNRIPQLALRTTVIVGFPGETEQHFQELLRFIQETQFQHLGIFAYSPEKGAPSQHYPNQIPEEVRQERCQILAEVQKNIVQKINSKKIGQTLTAMIDDQPSPGLYTARSPENGPEIDNLIYFRSPLPHQIGDFIHLKITNLVDDYDMEAQPILEKSLRSAL